MGRTAYDLRNPDDVNRYLDAVDYEHNTAFEMWRKRRVSEGFHIFTVTHPEGEPRPPSETGFPSHSPDAWYRPRW